MAIIFITAWIIGFYSGNFLSYETDGSFKGDVITLHKNIATTIIFLVMIRLFWRYTHPAPQLPDSMSPLMKKLAHAGHLALYFILLALPLLAAYLAGVLDTLHLCFTCLISLN
jgi:cytochrome b561